jgi:hypothetical protein
MSTHLLHDPSISSLTPDEFERMVYVEPWATTPRMQQYLEALHDAEQAGAVRDVLGNFYLDFDDAEDLAKNIEALSEMDDKYHVATANVEKLLDTIDTVVDILQKPAKHGSEYAKAALAELVFVVSQINEER